MRILNVYESPSFELDDADRHLAQTMAIRLGAGVVSALACAGLVRVWWLKNLSEFNFPLSLLHWLWLLLLLLLLLLRLVCFVGRNLHDALSLSCDLVRRMPAAVSQVASTLR